MPISNLFTNDLDSATPAELALAIMQLARSGIEEKFRLDFKETWEPDKQCPDVAAMANCYGGLLIIGVSDDRQRLPGIVPPRNSDTKTQVSSTIATRIAPVPIFEVHTCPAPDDTDNVLVAIRVAAQPRVHMYLKGDRPVYVRNEDGTIPARAPQLQYLLDRVRSAELSQPSMANPLTEVARDFYVTKANSIADRLAVRQAFDNRHQSGAALVIGLVPDRPANLSIDVTLERRFTGLINAAYPSIGQRCSVDRGLTVFEYEDRRNSWFSFRHRDLDRDHEIVWAFDSRGIVQGVFEVAERLGDGPAELWSIADLFINLNSTMRLAHEFWTGLGIFCGCHIAATLEILTLVPFYNQNSYPPLFYEDPIAIPGTAVQKVYGPYPVSRAAAGSFLTYDDLNARRRESVIVLGSQLLRDLRFSTDTGMLGVALGEAEKSSYDGTTAKQ